MLYKLYLFAKRLVYRSRYKKLSLDKAPTAFIDSSADLVTHGQGSIRIGDRVFIGKHTEIGTSGKISIGSDTSIQKNCIILGEVEIGSSCIFAPNIFMSSGKHHMDIYPEWYIRDQDAHAAGLTADNEKMEGRVVIEDDCWIGINTVIMAGVTIHKGSIIGANSVVTKNIQPYSICTGSPAKWIRNRLEFSPPKKLDYKISGQLPYFYKGCFCSQAELSISTLQDGIFTGRSFVLALSNSENKKTICLVVKNTTKQKIKLNHNGQWAEIESGDQFWTVYFPCTTETYYSFETTADSPKPLLIQQAFFM